MALIEDVYSRYDALMLQCQSLINEQNAQTARTPEATSNAGKVVLVSAVTTSANRYTSRRDTDQASYSLRIQYITTVVRRTTMRSL